MKREELLDKLEQVSKALSTENLVPLFQCFCFTGSNVTAFNGDNLAIRASCKTKEAFAVNGKVLMGLLNNSRAEEIDFTLGSENDLIVKADKSTFKLPYFPKTDFLFVEPDKSSPDTFDLSEGHELLRGVVSCLATTGNDISQKAFMGVHFNQQGDTVWLYSTNGDAISRYCTDFPCKGTTKNYVLSNEFCDAIADIGWEQDGELALTDEWAIAIMDNNYTVYGRLLELDNPLDHEAEIKKTVKGSISYIPVPDGLTAALSRARVLSDIESAPSLLTIKNKRLALHTQNQLGVVDDALDLNHRDVEASVSASLMQNCLRFCDEMAILENCCCFRKEDKHFILTSNMGE